MPAFPRHSSGASGPPPPPLRAPSPPLLVPEPVRRRDPSRVAVDARRFARDVGGALAARAPRRPLRMAPQLELAHDGPRTPERKKLALRWHRGNQSTYIYCVAGENAATRIDRAFKSRSSDPQST